jgi:hypothetical protein
MTAPPKKGPLPGEQQGAVEKERYSDITTTPWYLSIAPEVLDPFPSLVDDADYIPTWPPEPALRFDPYDLAAVAVIHRRPYDPDDLDEGYEFIPALRLVDPREPVSQEELFANVSRSADLRQAELWARLERLEAYARERPLNIRETALRRLYYRRLWADPDTPTPKRRRRVRAVQEVSA